MSLLLRKESELLCRGNVSCSVPGGQSENQLLRKESSKEVKSLLLLKESGREGVEIRAHPARLPHLPIAMRYVARAWRRSQVRPEM